VNDVAKKEFIYVFLDKDGNAFAEYPSGSLHTQDEQNENIRKSYTKCLIDAARALGFAPKAGELEKLGSMSAT
jgi:hypothetical protein